MNGVIHTKKHKTRALALLLCLALALTGAQPLFARVVVVQKDQVNVRQGASTASSILGKVGKGVTFGWQGASGDWTQILYGAGQTGFIRNDLLQGYDDVSVTGSSVRIRKSPSLQGEILGSADKGDKLTVLDYREGWYKVQYKQGEGWISADYAKPGISVTLSSAPFAASLPQTAQAAQASSQASASTVAGTPATGAGAAAGAAAAAADKDGQSAAAQGAATGQSATQPLNLESVSVSTGATGGVLSGRIITLDPGHGSRGDDGRVDPGAEGITLGIWEKDVNLDIALKLRTLLENLGATVWMTHMGSTGLSLYGRAALANQNASDIFVSIHTNSSVNTALNGHSVYFYAPVSDGRLSMQRPLRQALARYVQDSMAKTCGRADLGVKESNFVVLREANCPAILIETAFLSDTEEEALLAQGAFRQKLAEAIASGLLKYFGVG